MKLLKNFLREKVGWGLEKAKTPALVKEFEFVDLLTDETIYLSTGKTYTTLSVGSRQFYFDRLTGSLDGAGLRLPDCVSRRVEFPD